MTLRKAAVEAAGNTEYPEIEVCARQLHLTPVRIQRADAVRAKLAELDLRDDDLAAAVTWARKASLQPGARAAEPKSSRRAMPPRKRKTGKPSRA